MSFSNSEVNIVANKLLDRDNLARSTPFGLLLVLFVRIAQAQLQYYVYFANWNANTEFIL